MPFQDRIVESIFPDGSGEKNYRCSSDFYILFGEWALN